MGTLLHCWWEYKLVQPLWRTVWTVLKKLEIELPYGSSAHGLSEPQFPELSASQGSAAAQVISSLSLF